MPHPLIPELERIAQSAVDAAGFGLRAVQLHTHRIPMTVQVLVQRRDGSDISLDDCASLSAPLGEAIEAAGLLGEAAYVLEVSSPGLSEELRDDRDFRSFRGFPVAVRYRDIRGSEAHCDGLLLERTASELQINIRGRTKRIPRETVITVRLVSAGDDTGNHN
ncbi:MAG: ribosome maturation factor RimP [Synechococcaceae cyanobacterium]